jgi:wobble nucleotide-excising tRNase
MIKKIKRIKNFGIFSDFSLSSDVKDFAKYNLIYGWNYSGKTTLSRIFRCFEQGCIPVDFAGASFEVIDSNEGILTEQYLDIAHAVRVFNSDFVEDNLQWKSDLEPIFLIGQVNIEKQEELDFETNNLQTISESILGIKNTINEIDKSINDALTSRARDIKQLLSLPDYNKTKFETKIVSIADIYDQHILEDSEFTAVWEEYHSTEKRDSLQYIDELVFDTTKITKKVKLLLETTVVSKTIARLKENEYLNEWVKTGLIIHKEKSECEFCGGKFSQELLNNLNEHFSADFDTLMNDIESTVSELKNRTLDLSFPDSANLYNELKDEYKEGVKSANDVIISFNEQIASVIEILLKKKGKAFSKLELYDLTDHTIMVNDSIKKINQTIKIHNDKTGNFDAIKATTKEKIILHYCAKYIIDDNYFEKKDHRSKNLLSLSTFERGAESSQAKIAELELILSETVKGADKINGYLKTFFGKNDLQIVVNQNSRFQLHRRGNIAKNLSEGEKTAIAFAYFMTRLEDKNTKLKDTIVYLDDPISSLDSNHIFNIYAFIKTKLSSCKQLFISTHNSEFFNIIKDWYDDHKNNKSLFIIERTANASVDKSYLKNIPLLMDKYKSEYVYLFSVINDFKNGPSMDFQMLYNLPNIMRRFLEAYTSFKIPKSAGLEKKLRILIEDPIKLERINKFVQQNSHTSSINSGIKFPNLTEVTDIIELIFEMITLKDSDHFTYLLEAAGGNTGL